MLLAVLMAVLEAVEVSELSKGVWTEDFSDFVTVFPSKKVSKAAWTNCVTKRYWQAYFDAAEPAKIVRNRGKWSIGGLYAYWDGSNAASYALGQNVGSTQRVAVCGLTFHNDLPRAIPTIRVAYDGRQFGFKNRVPQTIEFETLTTNELVSIASDGVWKRHYALTARTPATYESGYVSGESDPLTVEVNGKAAVDWSAGDYLLVRWRRDRVTYSTAFAIDNIELDFGLERPGMRLIIK